MIMATHSTEAGSDARSSEIGLVRRLANLVRSVFEVAADAQELRRAMDKRYGFIDS
jgi:hypothetical protein